jgi:PadR family transcriptional regulator, regulatory protein PadR
MPKIISSEKQKLILGSFRSTTKNQKIMAIYLGEFEELVLLTVAALDGDAYGVSIQQDIETRCKRSISIGALHSTITRLEEKGFLKSWTGGATQERGGRSKRYFEVTQAGKKALTESKSLRDELWSLSKAKLSIVK